MDRKYFLLHIFRHNSRVPRLEALFVNTTSISYITISWAAACNSSITLFSRESIIAVTNLIFLITVTTFIFSIVGRNVFSIFYRDRISDRKRVLPNTSRTKKQPRLSNRPSNSIYWYMFLIIWLKHNVKFWEPATWGWKWNLCNLISNFSYRFLYVLNLYPNQWRQPWEMHNEDLFQEYIHYLLNLFPGEAQE